MSADFDSLVQAVEEAMDSDIRLLLLLTGVTLKEYEEGLDGIKTALAKRAVRAVFDAVPAAAGDLDRRWKVGDRVEYYRPYVADYEPTVPGVVTAIDTELSQSKFLRVRFDENAKLPEWMEREQHINPSVMRHVEKRES